MTDKKFVEFYFDPAEPKDIAFTLPGWLLYVDRRDCVYPEDFKGVVHRGKLEDATRIVQLCFGLQLCFHRGRFDDFAVLLRCENEETGQVVYSGLMDSHYFLMLKEVQYIIGEARLKALLQLLIRDVYKEPNFEFLAVPTAPGKKIGKLWEEVCRTEIQRFDGPIFDEFRKSDATKTMDEITFFRGFLHTLLAYFYYTMIAENNKVLKSGRPTAMGAFIKYQGLYRYLNGTCDLHTATQDSNGGNVAVMLTYAKEAGVPYVTDDAITTWDWFQDIWMKPEHRKNVVENWEKSA